MTGQLWLCRRLAVGRRDSLPRFETRCRVPVMTPGGLPIRDTADYQSALHLFLQNQNLESLAGHLFYRRFLIAVCDWRF